MRVTPPPPPPAPAVAPAVRVFHDGGGCFGPLTDLGPAASLLAGGRTLGDRAVDRLRRRPAGGAVLRVNGRWDGLDPAVAAWLVALRPGEALVERGSDPAGGVVGLVAEEAAAEAWEAAGCSGLPAGVEGGGEPAEGVLVARPWHLLERLTLGLAVDADAWVAEHAIEEDPAATGREGVHVHPGARVHPTAVLDGASGPVVVETGAHVQAFAFVEGPAWIGRGSTLAPHTQVRGPAAVGAGCKVGGEVKTLLFGPHANKAHGGYLGDAVVGPWCNLGAGTTASNLKNTYGSVRVRLSADAEREDTGRLNQGPVIGPFVKTAIGTRLPTGCVVGTGACLAGSAIAPTFVPPMTFTTDAGVERMKEEPFLRTVQRQMARRGREPDATLVAKLRALIPDANDA